MKPFNNFTYTPYGLGAVTGSLPYVDPQWLQQNPLLPYQTGLYGQTTNPFLTQGFGFHPYSQFLPGSGLNATNLLTTPFYTNPYLTQVPQWNLGIDPSWLLYSQLHQNLLKQPNLGIGFSGTGMTPWNLPTTYYSPENFERMKYEGLGTEMKSGSWIGPATGRMPKNYRRSDEMIKDEVCERLTLHPMIDPSDVEIIVKDGEVTLRGTVEDRLTKRTIENIVESVFGVRDILNDVKVTPRYERESKERERELAGKQK